MTILQFFLWSLIKVIVVTVVMLLCVAYTVLLERKLVGPYSKSLGTHPRGTVWIAAAARRRRQVLSQGRHHSDGRLSPAVSARAGDLA